MTDDSKQQGEDGGPVHPETARQVNDVDYVHREEALAMLGIKKESLYTYVSRGLIKTRPEPGKKTSLYRKADLEKLKTRAGTRKGAKPVAHVLRYGEPVIQSWICEIGPQGPRYRGLAALDLAREGRSLEYVADLIWGGLPPSRDKPWPAQRHASVRDLCQAQMRAPHGIAPIRTLAAIALHFSNLEMPAETPAQGDIRAQGMRLLTAFAGVSGYFGPKPRYQQAKADEFIVQRLMQGFGLAGRPGAGKIAEALAAALVLSVDHELSAPTFCARISASTGVDAHACVASALIAQAGPMQAGGIMDVEDFLRETLHTAAPRMPVRADFPCFGHPLYDKDPRSELLLEYVAALAGDSPARAALLRFIERQYRESGRFPNLFAALTVLSMTLELPKGTAIYLHSLARTAGWLAHVAEQRLAGGMLRPRARYMGASSERLL